MLISLDWLKDFVDIPKDLDPEDLANELTLKTAEVDDVIKGGQGLEDIVIGEILEINPHPNADKLNLAKIDIGKSSPLRLIFGQMMKMKVGNRVPVAVAPATLPTGVKIEKCKIRGETSEGMLCLDQELGFKEKGVSIQYFPDTKPGTPLAQALGLKDTVFEFDNKALTHRPDLWGHLGIAREVACITNSKFKYVDPKPPIPTKGETIKVEIKDFDLCPRFCALIINNIKVQDSPEWLASRLKAVGHGTHNNIVDVTNYVMAEIGQPMHAFDKSLIKGGIVVRMAKDKESITTLDGKQKVLTRDIGVVADHEKVTSLAGIMGAQSSEIGPKTTSIILEAANWHPAILRRASIKLGIRTDAVQRFEKSLDPNLPELAIKKAAELILKICPDAEIAGPITDIQKFDKSPVKISLDLEKTRSKIGVDIPSRDIKKILQSLEFKVKEKSKNTFQVTVPSFRSTKDVHIEDDLIEEVARIYGYENIPTSLPTLPTKLPEKNTERFKKHRTRELFSYALGFDEIYNYSFYGENEINKCLMTDDNHLKLLNYLSEDQTHLRTTLVPNLLKNLQLNIKYFDQVRLYEIGRTYKEIDEYFPLEEKKVGGAILKKEKVDSSPGSSDPFFEAKGAVEAFFHRFNLKKVKVVKGTKALPYAHPSKGLTYLSGAGQTLAQVFTLHPTVQKNHDLKAYPIALFEINFTEVLKLDHPVRTYKPLPKFPPIRLDISVVIDRTTEIKTLREEIFKANKGLIKAVELFDIYEGENIPQDKKAVAFTLTLQAQDRTLTDNDMASAQSQIFKNLEKLGGEIRGKKSV
jgi:phenylalanyl-tRNA synthetase beta chain